MTTSRSQDQTKTPGGLIIVGAGGHARVVLSALDTRSVQGLLDPAFAPGSSIDGAIVLGGEEALLDRSGPMHVAVGNNQRRSDVVERLGHKVWRTIVSTVATTPFGLLIGEGTFVGHRAVIQPGAQIGRHVIINTGAIVEHDCVVEDFVHIGPGAVLCGGVSVGQAALIGASAVIAPGVTIGKGATVGAGAVVLRDVVEGATVVGNPARPLER